MNKIGVLTTIMLTVW